ncbi:MAG: hypothetical protein ABEI77_00505 [Halorientalis sp.]
MGAITVFTTAEYEAQEFDAVLINERGVVCVRADDGAVRFVPMDKVNHIDGDTEHLLIDGEIPDSFYGGANRAFVDVEQFPEIEGHLNDRDAESY